MQWFFFKITTMNRLYQIAETYFRSGKYEDSKKIILNLLRSNPKDYKSQELLAYIYGNLGDNKKAKEILHKLVKQNNCTREGMYELGNLLFNEGKFEESLASYIESMKQGDYFEGAYCVGLVYVKLGKIKEGKEFFNKAKKIQPDSVLVAFNLAGIEEEEGSLDGAIALYKEATELDPSFFNAWFNLSALYCEKNNIEMAVKSLEKCLEISPASYEARYSLGNMLLYKKEFEKGWLLYEDRWKIRKFNSENLGSEIKKWDGGDIKGRLLIWHEQGLGDQILYSSILNELQNFNEKITVCVDERLIPIFKRSFKKFEFCEKNNLKKESYTEQISLASLGIYYRKNIGDFEKIKKEYLLAEEIKKNRYRNIIYKKKLVCGISWISKNKELEKNKSIKLKDLKPILLNEALSITNLQYGDTSEEIKEFEDKFSINIEEVSEVDKKNNLDDLAALIMACDIIVTVSNSTAHLAGALGKEVYLLLPTGKAKFWYWHSRNNRSIWYPSIKLFEKKIDEPWEKTIVTVNQSIKLDYENRKD